MTPETNAQSATTPSSDAGDTVADNTPAEGAAQDRVAQDRAAQDRATQDRAAQDTAPSSEAAAPVDSSAATSVAEPAAAGSDAPDAAPAAATSGESSETATDAAASDTAGSDAGAAGSDTAATDTAAADTAVTSSNGNSAKSESRSGVSADEASSGGQSAPSPQPGQAAAAEGQAGAEAGGVEGKKKRRRRRRKKKKTAAGAEAEAKPRPATERAPFHVGEEVFGKVTAVLEHAIMVDLSGKALAIFDRGEMEPDDLVPEVGDRFLARIHQDGSRGGLVVLTRKPLREEEAKAKIEKAAAEGNLIDGLVTGVIKGGVDVDIDGLRAFAPASGMDLHPQNANFASLVGQRLDFKVSQYEKQGRDVVVTRRPMLENEAHERRKRALELLKEGQELKAVVRTIVDWGVFAALPDAENLEGLIHVSEASHDARPRLTELFKPGDEFSIKITKIDERGKIWLSRKALIEDPWAEAREKYKPGNKLKAKIARVERFGAFVTLEHGIDGLIHVSDLAFKRVDHPRDVVQEGQDIEVVVHHLDLKNRKVALHPALAEEYAGEEPQQLSRNASVEVSVIKAESSGLQVRVLGVTGRGARGFIPAGQTGTERGTDLRQRFKQGTKLRAKVIDLDPRRGEPKLSIKQLAEDEERRAHREYRKQLAKESGFGTLGDLLSAKLEQR